MKKSSAESLKVKRGHSRLRRFIRGRRGASFVEFAIVAVPLFTLIFGIIEVGLVFWASYELENATETAARYIRTGQAQGSGWSVAQLTSQICANVVILANCTSSVQLDVETFSTFGGITAPTPFNNKGALRNDFDYVPGGPGSIVLVTAFYEWPLINPLMTATLGNMSDGNFLLRSSAAFRNEPFPAT